MGGIQIVSGSEVDTPDSSPKIDGSAFQRAGMAGIQLGQAIGNDVGGFFSDVSQKFQQVRNTRTILDADVAMRKTADDYRDSLKANPDENTWLPGWKDQSDQLRDNILNGPNVGPDVKRHLTGMLDTWQQANTSEFKTAAQLQTINKAKEAGTAAYTYAAAQGDQAGAMAAIDLLKNSHAIFPEQADAMKRQVPNLIQKSQVDTGIANDPGKTLELLKDQDANGRSKHFPNLNPKDLVQLMFQANKENNIRLGQNLQDHLQDIAATPDGTVDPKVVQGWVDSPDPDLRISQTAANNIIKGQTKQDIKQSQDDFNLLMMQAQNTDFTTTKTPEEEARKMKDDAAGLPVALQRRFSAFVDNRVQSAQKQGQTAERPVERDVFERMRNDPIAPDAEIIKELTRKDSQGKFEVSDKTFAKRYPGQDRTAMVTAAQTSQAQKFDKMRQWFSDPANKDATEEQAEAYRQGLNRPEVMAKVQSTISLPGSSGQYVTGKQYKDKNGNIATWNGKGWDEGK